MKIKGIYFLYRVLQAFGLPVLVLYFLFRAFRNRGYWKSLPQRFGFLPRSFRQTSPGAIWLHAVSVGEVLACMELLRRLRAEFPNSSLFVSATTLAGNATAREKLHGLADGVFFAPVDYAFAVRRVLRCLRPSVVVVAETEIWPNLFREVKRTGAGLVIVNGRISDKALPGYLKLRPFFEAVLPQVDSILAQSDPIRDRFLSVGAPATRVRTAGNLKFDFEARSAPPDSPVSALIERLRPSAVWIAASTMGPAAPDDPDEDDVVIGAFRQLADSRPGLLLILVPRKPERFDAAARKLESAGIPFVRRTALPATFRQPPRAILLDTIGELSGLFGVADVVFMGGSLARRGGHNILEPALFGKPVIVGPHMENFQEISDQFRAADACIPIAGSAGLAPALERLLADPALARATGSRARACAETRRGATGRAVAEIRELYRAQIPYYRSAMPWFGIGVLLTEVWKWGGQRRWKRGMAQRRNLDIPVISIGNITMGGTGKTPCVLRLAEALTIQGLKPGILTRGYGRTSPDKFLILPAGAKIPTEHSGDEPQIFIRSGLAPVGIGGDRFQTGTMLRQRFDLDILLMDDGFQHARLARDVDIVLIDALNPFGGGYLFPLGRLREPLAGLARADVILITRSRFSDLPPTIEQVIRRWNPDAPVFRSSIHALGWVEHRTGTRFLVEERPFQKVGVFCGLGNPQSFRRSLAALGIEPVCWIDFEDHHRYRPRELRMMAQQFRLHGATAAITTEKDAVNLCEGCDELFAPLPIYWLRVGMRIEREQEFVAAIERRIRRAGLHPAQSDTNISESAQ